MVIVTPDINEMLLQIGKNVAVQVLNMKIIDCVFRYQAGVGKNTTKS